VKLELSIPQFSEILAEAALIEPDSPGDYVHQLLLLNRSSLVDLGNNRTVSKTKETNRQDQAYTLQ
jgi:hypothetical protein